MKGCVLPNLKLRQQLDGVLPSVKGKTESAVEKQHRVLQCTTLVAPPLQGED